jgi:hypothetical protein
MTTHWCSWITAASWVLKSGAITGNAHIGSVGANGGGVSVYKGMFRMEGGAISDNSTASGKGGSVGGGVYVGEASVFTMTGGEIFDNTAGINGGGVYVKEGGTFTMEDGTISDNTVGNQGCGIDSMGTRLYPIRQTPLSDLP